MNAKIIDRSKDLRVLEDRKDACLCCGMPHLNMAEARMLTALHAAQKPLTLVELEAVINVVPRTMIHAYNRRPAIFTKVMGQQNGQRCFLYSLSERGKVYAQMLTGTN